MKVRVLPLKLHSICEPQALSFGLLITEQTSLDEEHGKGMGGRWVGEG